MTMTKEVLTALWAKMKATFSTKKEMDQLAEAVVQVTDQAVKLADAGVHLEGDALPAAETADVRTVYETGGVYVGVIDLDFSDFGGRVVNGVVLQDDGYVKVTVWGCENMPETARVDDVDILELVGARVDAAIGDGLGTALLAVNGVSGNITITRVRMKGREGCFLHEYGSLAARRAAGEWEVRDLGTTGTWLWEGRKNRIAFGPRPDMAVGIGRVEVEYEVRKPKRDYVARDGGWCHIGYDCLPGQVGVRTKQGGIWLEGAEAWLAEGYVPVLLRHRKNNGCRKWVPMTIPVYAGQILSERRTALVVGEGGRLTVPKLVLPEVVANGISLYGPYEDPQLATSVKRFLEYVNGAPDGEQEGDVAGAFVCDCPMRLLATAVAEGWGGDAEDWLDGYTGDDWGVFWCPGKMTFTESTVGEGEYVYKVRHFGFAVQMVHMDEVGDFLNRGVRPLRVSNLARFEVVSQGCRENGRPAWPSPSNKQERYRFSVT